jgi:antitoxin component YwqK of YwqJK toxin-antitoxin module
MKFRTRHLFIITAVIAFAIATPQLYLRLPGSLYFDSSGRPHGTGLKKYFYESGSLMIDEYYSVGEMTRSVWYHPNGSVVADVVIPDKTKTFVGYYLNQNGTVRKKMTYRFNDSDHGWLADGPCECFDEDGHPTGIETYSRGRRVPD